MSTLKCRGFREIFAHRTLPIKSRVVTNKFQSFSIELYSHFHWQVDIEQYTFILLLLLFGIKNDRFTEWCKTLSYDSISQISQSQCTILIAVILFNHICCLFLYFTQCNALNQNCRYVLFELCWILLHSSFSISSCCYSIT